MSSTSAAQVNSASDEQAPPVRRAGRPKAGGSGSVSADESGPPVSRHPEGDPLAIAMFHTLADEPESGIALVLNALRRSLPPTWSSDSDDPDEALHARAVDSLAFFLAESEKASCGAYDKWYGGHQLKGQLLPSSKLRSLLGGPEKSWEEAKRHVSRPAYDPAALKLTQAVSPLQLHEVVEPLEHWLGETQGPIRRSDFLNWYAAQVEEADHPWPRKVPITSGGLHKLIGWEKLLGDLGHADRLWRREEATVEPLAGLRKRIEAPTKEEIDSHVRAAWEDLGADGWMTGHEYDRWAKSARATLRHRGESGVRVPSLDQAQDFYGSWAQVLLGAELVDVRTAAQHIGHGRRLSDEERRIVFAEAILAQGVDIAPDGYQAHRADLRKEAAERGEVLHLPSEGTLRMRLGGPSRSWPIARRETLRWMHDTGFAPPDFVIPAWALEGRA